MRARLLLDMDGPLADFDAHFFRRCRERGWHLDIDDPSQSRHRFMTDHLPDSAERAAARYMVDSDPHWFDELPPVPGAIEGVREILDLDVDVWVVTKPLEANPTCRDGKARWLRHWLPELETRLVIAPDKSIVSGDVLLDDAPKLSWLRRADWAAVVFRTPFNGPGSEWGHLPSWAWGDPVEDLFRPGGLRAPH